MVYAQNRNFDARNSWLFSDTNGSPNLSQKIKSSIDPQEKKKELVVDFAIPADYIVKMK